MGDKAGIPEATLSDFKKKFCGSEKNLLAQNVCYRTDLWETCRQQDLVWSSPHVFNCKAGEGKPMTNQKSSGRCWLFACLNVLRVPVAKHFKLDEMEFSQNYLFFWDKVERANYLLDVFIDISKKGENPEGRLMSHLLHNPVDDGGQWDMLVNVVEKHGLVPKACFPDAFSAEASLRMGRMINNKMREFCMCLHRMVNDKKSDEEIAAEKMKMLEEIYRMCSISLGTPPDTITWEFYDNEKKYQKIGPIKPIDFYKQHIKPLSNLEDMICIVNDPRPENTYNKLYTVEYLNNMTSARTVLYINQPIQVLKDLALASIREGQAVWFGCDVGKFFSRKPGILDLNIINTDLVFGTSLLGMNKAERLQYGDSLMTHAMVLTATHVEDEKKTVRWRVENSWGDADGDKGFITMTDDWFSEFVYEVVVDKKHVPSEILDVLKQTPVVLPAWDPMGALAVEPEVGRVSKL